MNMSLSEFDAGLKFFNDGGRAELLICLMTGDYIKISGGFHV